jgi:hypothetical protein
VTEVPSCILVDWGIKAGREAVLAAAGGVVRNGARQPFAHSALVGGLPNQQNNANIL